MLEFFFSFEHEPANINSVRYLSCVRKSFLTSQREREREMIKEIELSFIVVIN